MDSWLDLHRYRTDDLIREATTARTRRLATRTPRRTTTYRLREDPK